MAGVGDGSPETGDELMSGINTTRLYELLGCDMSANEQQLRKGYYVQSLRYHPDKNPDGGDRYREIATAYRILSNGKLRNLYNKYGEGGVEHHLAAESRRASQEVLSKVQDENQRDNLRLSQFPWQYHEIIGEDSVNMFVWVTMLMLCAFATFLVLLLSALVGYLEADASFTLIEAQSWYVTLTPMWILTLAAIVLSVLAFRFVSKSRFVEPIEPEEKVKPVASPVQPPPSAGRRPSRTAEAPHPASGRTTEDNHGDEDNGDEDHDVEPRRRRRARGSSDEDEDSDNLPAARQQRGPARGRRPAAGGEGSSGEDGGSSGGAPPARRAGGPDLVSSLSSESDDSDDSDAPRRKKKKKKRGRRVRGGGPQQPLPPRRHRHRHRHRRRDAGGRPNRVLGGGPGDEPGASAPSDRQGDAEAGDNKSRGCCGCVCCSSMWWWATGYADWTPPPDLFEEWEEVTKEGEEPRKKYQEADLGPGSIFRPITPLLIVRLVLLLVFEVLVAVFLEGVLEPVSPEIRGPVLSGVLVFIPLYLIELINFVENCYLSTRKRYLKQCAMYASAIELIESGQEDIVSAMPLSPEDFGCGYAGFVLRRHVRWIWRAPFVVLFSLRASKYIETSWWLVGAWLLMGVAVEWLAYVMLTTLVEYRRRTETFIARVNDPADGKGGEGTMAGWGSLTKRKYMQNESAYFYKKAVLQAVCGTIVLACALTMAIMGSVSLEEPDALEVIEVMAPLFLLFIGLCFCCSVLDGVLCGVAGDVEKARLDDLWEKEKDRKREARSNVRNNMPQHLVDPFAHLDELDPIHENLPTFKRGAEEARRNKARRAADKAEREREKSSYTDTGPSSVGDRWEYDEES